MQGCVAAFNSRAAWLGCHPAASEQPPPTTVRPARPQAVCFLRPTRENIARIRRELRDPRFGEYHLCEWVVGTTGQPSGSRVEGTRRLAAALPRALLQSLGVPGAFQVELHPPAAPAASYQPITRACGLFCRRPQSLPTAWMTCGCRTWRRWTRERRWRRCGRRPVLLLLRPPLLLLPLPPLGCCRYCPG